VSAIVSAAGAGSCALELWGMWKQTSAVWGRVLERQGRYPAEEGTLLQ